MHKVQVWRDDDGYYVNFNTQYEETAGRRIVFTKHAENLEDAIKEAQAEARRLSLMKIVGLNYPVEI